MGVCVCGLWREGGLAELAEPLEPSEAEAVEAVEDLSEMAEAFYSKRAQNKETDTTMCVSFGLREATEQTPLITEWTVGRVRSGWWVGEGRGGREWVRRTRHWFCLRRKQGHDTPGCTILSALHHKETHIQNFVVNFEYLCRAWFVVALFFLYFFSFFSFFFFVYSFFFLFFSFFSLFLSFLSFCFSEFV